MARDASEAEETLASQPDPRREVGVAEHEALATWPGGTRRRALHTPDRVIIPDSAHPGNAADAVRRAIEAERLG